MNALKREQIKLRLEELENNGRLTPAAVVADAQLVDSPLHDQFEWDKDKAAYQHWLDQARNIITSVRIIHRTETSLIKTVYYVRDPSAEHSEQGYVSVPRLRTDADLARDVLVSEFSAVADRLRRARELAKALSLDDEVDKIMSGVVELRGRVMEAPTQRM